MLNIIILCWILSRLSSLLRTKYPLCMYPCTLCKILTECQLCARPLGYSGEPEQPACAHFLCDFAYAVPTTWLQGTACHLCQTHTILSVSASLPLGSISCLLSCPHHVWAKIPFCDLLQDPVLTTVFTPVTVPCLLTYLLAFFIEFYIPMRRGTVCLSHHCFLWPGT